MSQVTTPILSGGTGQAYAPVTADQAASCSSLLGRKCVVNVAYVILRLISWTGGNADAS